MPDITIPDAAVEAAARADYYNVMVEVEVPFEVYENREWWLNNSRIALAAAAPFIAAQALRDVAGIWERVADPEFTKAARRLRNIANRIEPDHG